MKTKMISISLIILGIISAFAQQTPEPPKPPKVTHTNSDSYSSNTVVTVDGDQKSNTSIAIKNTNAAYKLRARFGKEKMQEIKRIIIAKMGTKNLKIINGKHAWAPNSNNSDVYEIDLTKSKINMYINKDVASLDLVEKFKNIGVLIKASFSDKGKTTTQIKGEADRLQHEADKLKRDAERIQREADRLKTLYEQDAERYKKEAERYKKEAKRLAEKAKAIREE